MLHIDICGRLPLSLYKYSYIFTIVDSTSRNLEFIPLKKTDTQTIINSLIEYFCRYGYPQAIVADNGSNFRSKLLKEFLCVLGIKMRFTSVYKASSNAIAETPSQSIKSLVKSDVKRDFRMGHTTTFF